MKPNCCRLRPAVPTDSQPRRMGAAAVGLFTEAGRCHRAAAGPDRVCCTAERLQPSLLAALATSPSPPASSPAPAAAARSRMAAIASSGLGAAPDPLAASGLAEESAAYFSELLSYPL